MMSSNSCLMLFDMRSSTLIFFQALPSPTTGTFPLLPPSDDSSVLKSGTHEDGHRGSDFGSSFTFKRQGDPKYLPGYSSFENQVMVTWHVSFVQK